jgi:hypothetical protein
MPIIPSIEKRLYRSIPIYDLAPSGIEMDIFDQPIIGYTSYADIYINLYNEFGEPVNGDYAKVQYQEYYNGVAGPVLEAVIPGQSFMLKQYVVVYRNTGGGDNYTYDVQLVGTLVPGDGSVTLPTGACDVTIQSVVINHKESSAGAADGSVRIAATSTYLPLTYSVDGITYQDSATFDALAGGSYSAWVMDANGCTALSYFDLETANNLLVSDPSADAGSGNISRWSAAFNPIVFTYQRKDYGVAAITDYYGTAAITVNGYPDKLKANDSVYLKAGSYNGVYQVNGIISENCFTINRNYVASGSHSGFVNINAQRPYYAIKTSITYQNKLTNQTETIISTHRPDSTGLVRADLSSFLQSLVQPKDNSSYNQVNFRDENLSASYQVSYAEVWDGHPVTYISLPEPFYVMYAARQLGQAFNGNMAAYVPFKTVDGTSRRAQWVTDFAEPAFSNRYPFDISFIYSEDLAGLDIYYELTPLDVNRQPLPGGVLTSYLLNEDSSFLRNQDGSRLVIATQPITSQPVSGPIAEHIGLNRLLIDNTFADEVHFFSLVLKYNDGETVHTITQAQTIRLDDAVDDSSVYLRWIGLTGSWNYYRFVYNQEISLDVQNAVIIKRFVSNWANQDAIEEVISKSAGQKMKVMAEDLSIADIKGLQSIKYSPKVQMLIGRNPVKWQTIVINTATYAEYETRNGQAPFSLTFNLPGLNVQSQ